MGGMSVPATGCRADNGREHKGWKGEAVKEPNIMVATFEKIRELAEPIMTAYQSDLEHDRKWLQENQGKPFIHVTRESGTHLIPVPRKDSFIDDSPVPHLFGEAKPSEICRQQENCLRRELRESAKLWLRFDGKRLSVSSAEACTKWYAEQCQAAERIRWEKTAQRRTAAA